MLLDLGTLSMSQALGGAAGSDSISHLDAGRVWRSQARQSSKHVSGAFWEVPFGPLVDVVKLMSAHYVNRVFRFFAWGPRAIERNRLQSRTAERRSTNRRMLKCESVRPLSTAGYAQRARMDVRPGLAHPLHLEDNGWYGVRHLRLSETMRFGSVWLGPRAKN